MCYENIDQEYNCGKCEKCIRTMTNLAIAGLLDRCTTFGNVITLEELLQKLKDFVPESEAAELLLNDNINAAERVQADPRLKYSLRCAAARNPDALHRQVIRPLRKLRLRARRSMRRRHENRARSLEQDQG